METKTAAKPASGEKAEEKMAMMDMAGDDAGKNKLFAAKAQTREFFPDTALFDPHVVTDAKGAARVRMKYPDSLTTWAVRAIGVNKGSLVGTASASTVTKKRITARIETPRFLVEGDKVTLAAVIRNDFEKEVEISVLIEVEGDSIGLSGASSRKISLKPHTEERIDFSGYARTDGEAVVKLSALSKDESDVLMKKFPVMVYGSEKMVTQGLIIKDGGKGNLKFDVPEKRDADSTRLTLVMEPSVAGIMLQSLPYLISYPYGCIEQTTSRFIPLALTAQILKEHNIKLSSLGRLSEKGNLAAPLSEQQDVRLFDEPVFDDQTLEKWVRKGLQKIYSFQKGDGGFGWWSGFESDPYMTAYVVMALMDARDAGVEVNSGVIDRGLGFLLKKFKKDKSIESRNYM
ncbi:MAG: hypothetical protein FJ088_14935, partial [Deltaproteobacteria bacterium]|nr:hypothetical protein [Deltaproteobacteria bacterium]